jgi:hypothetical protein
MSEKNKGKITVNPLGIMRPVPGAGVGFNNSRKKPSPKKPSPKKPSPKKPLPKVKRRSTRRRARSTRVVYE